MTFRGGQRFRVTIPGTYNGWRGRRIANPPTERVASRCNHDRIQERIRNMRSAAWLVGSLLLGAIAGIGWSIFEYGGLPAETAVLIRPTSMEIRQAKVDPKTTPRAEVAMVEHDFGTMEKGTTQSYEFPIRNGGTVPLELEQVGTSCSCTVGGLDKNNIGPGEIAQVKLTWTATHKSPSFRHYGKIKTNDPAHPQIEFAIVGKVVDNIEVEPAIVQFDKKSDDSWSTNVKILSQSKEFKLTGYACDDAATAEQYAVELEQITPESSETRCEWLAKVTVKPGLPLGRVHQKIRLQTDLAEKEEVELVLTGAVGSVLRVMGARWNDTAGQLQLGKFDEGKGGTADLKVIARGADRDKIKWSVKEVSPAFLKIEIGEPEELAGGARVQYPIKIVIPADAPAASHFGGAASKLGEVLLNTGHPEQPELRFRVSFAVGS